MVWVKSSEDLFIGCEKRDKKKSKKRNEMGDGVDRISNGESFVEVPLDLAAVITK